MKGLFQEIIQKYDEKRGHLYEELNPEKPWWKEFFLPMDSAKAEDVIEKEIEFYRSFEDEINGTLKLRNKSFNLNDWLDISHFLKVHNERLSSQVDNSSTLSTIFAAMLALLAILGSIVGWTLWVIFAIVFFFGFKNFDFRIRKRHELSRNREILAVIENYINTKTNQSRKADG